MFGEELKALINRNEIDIETFKESIYNTLLLSIFEVLCLKMKDSNIKQEILSSFHKSQNYINTVENIVFKFTGCLISQSECEIISKWLIAYFRKDGRRKVYTKDFKISLLTNQSNKCKICGKDISYCDSELDHIIPWDFVGDELENNLQMLCNTCNARKGRSIEFQLKMLLINQNHLKNIG